MAETCKSYDLSRDADKLFDQGKVRFRPIKPQLAYPEDWEEQRE
jgi:predicted HAD superfamily Cof-like phosphohydrolase